MIRIVSFAVLAGGLVLLFMGYDASRSLGSEVSKLFTGNPSDRATMFIVAGVVLTALGLGGVVFGAKGKR